MSFPNLVAVEEVVSELIELTVDPTGQVGPRRSLFVGVGAKPLFLVSRAAPLDRVEQGINLFVPVVLAVWRVSKDLEGRNPESNEAAYTVLGHLGMCRQIGSRVRHVEGSE
jgi:hypothetical protein